MIEIFLPCESNNQEVVLIFMSQIFNTIFCYIVLLIWILFRFGRFKDIIFLNPRLFNESELMMSSIKFGKVWVNFLLKNKFPKLHARKCKNLIVFLYFLRGLII